MGAVFNHKAWHNGIVAGTYGALSVGATTQLNVNGVAKDFIVVHQGNPDGSLYDESCEGTWLLAKDITDYRAWHSSAVNSYGAASLHAFLNGTFLSRFDADVQSAIVQAKIPYVNGTGDAGNVVSGASGLSAKLFLLSWDEVGYLHGSGIYAPLDGAKLDYFKSGTSSSANALRIAEESPAAFIHGWWLRSPATNNATAANSVEETGAARTKPYKVTAQVGVRPCLIMPSNQKIFS